MQNAGIFPRSTKSSLGVGEALKRGNILIFLLIVLRGEIECFSKVLKNCLVLKIMHYFFLNLLFNMILITNTRILGNEQILNRGKAQ